MTNSVWVTLTFTSVMQSYHISSHGQQHVSDTDINSYVVLWLSWYLTIDSVWVTLAFISAMQSHHISSHDQQRVSDTDINCSLMTLITWPIACVWHWHLFLYSLIISHPMTNSVWVTLLFISAMQSHLISTHDQGCEWHWHLFLPCSLITFHPMTNSWWVTLSFICAMQAHYISSNDQQLVSGTDINFCHAVSSHHISWPTACKWHWHWILPVSRSLITSHPMTNSMWVTPLWCKLITPHPMTNSLWVTLTFISALQSHHISSYDYQFVSDADIYFCYAASSHFISSAVMTNRQWVTLTLSSPATSHYMINSM